MTNTSLKISQMTQANEGQAYVMVTQNLSTTPITRKAEINILSDGTIGASSSDSSGFSVNTWKHINGQDLIDARKVTSSNTRFSGFYRTLNTAFEPDGEAIGGIDWHSMLMSMVIAPSAFGTRDERLEIVEKLLNTAVVKRRDDSTNYKQFSLVQLSSGNVYWVNIAGQSSNTEPTEAGSVAFGDTLADGTMELTFTGYTANPNWNNYLLNYSNGLDVAATSPKDMDATAGLILTALKDCYPTPEWFATESNFTGVSYLQLLESIVTSCILDQLNNAPGSARLSTSLQNDGSRFLANNCEVYSGLKSLSKLFENMNDTTNKNTYNSHAEDVQSGIFSLYDGSNQKWKSYLGQVDHISKPNTYESFSSHYQYLMWPMFFGLFNDNKLLGKEETLLNLVNGYTEIFDENRGEFAEVFALYVMNKFYGIEKAKNKVFERTYSREPNNIYTNSCACFVSLTNQNIDTMENRLANLESGRFYKDISILGNLNTYFDYQNANSYSAIKLDSNVDLGQNWVRINVDYQGGATYNLLLESEETIRFKNSNGGDVLLKDKDFIPQSSGEINLGTVDNRYKNIFASGIINLANLPTSDPGVTGQLWNNAGDLKISQ